jgi:hypothetical protein
MLAVAPGLLASTLLGCLVIAWLPPPAGLAVCLGGLGAAALLAAGGMEDRAVRVLHRARALTAVEDRLLAPAVALLCAAGIGPPAITILRATGRGNHRIAARAAGRRCVLVTAALIREVHKGRLPADQAAAVVAAAVGRLDQDATRFDLAVALWLLPWRLVGAACAGVGGAVGWLPLTRFGWRLRFVVATVAVAQEVAAGRPVVGLVVAVVVALTHLAPRWRHAAEHRTQLDADRFVLEHGLGDPLGRFLRRRPTHPDALERVRRLPGPTTRPRLSLVPTARQ